MLEESQTVLLIIVALVDNRQGAVNIGHQAQSAGEAIATKQWAMGNGQ